MLWIRALAFRRNWDLLEHLEKGDGLGGHVLLPFVSIWKQMNCYIFQGKCLNSREVLRSLCMDKGYFNSTNNIVGSNRLTDSIIEWSKPPCSAVKINTDGARTQSK